MAQPWTRTEYVARFPGGVEGDPPPWPAAPVVPLTMPPTADAPPPLSVAEVANLEAAVTELERRNDADAAIPNGATDKQAVAIGVAIATVPQVVINLANAFGWFSFDGAQEVAVNSAWALLTTIVGWWVSSQVWCKKSVAVLQQATKES